MKAKVKEGNRNNYKNNNGIVIVMVGKGIGTYFDCFSMK